MVLALVMVLARVMVLACIMVLARVMVLACIMVLAHVMVLARVSPRYRRMKSSRPEGPPARSRALEGP